MARILVFGKEHFQRYFQDQSMVKWEHNRAALPSFEKESLIRELYLDQKFASAQVVQNLLL